MNGKVIGNRPLLVKYAENSGVPNASGVPSENIFVKVKKKKTSLRAFFFV